MRDPEPFVPPPAILSDLIERFEAGLQGYEKLHTAGVFATRLNETFMPPASTQQGTATLADILEEKENPVRPIPTRQSKSTVSSKLAISVLKYTSGKQSVATAPRYSLTDSDSDAAEDASGPHTGNDRDYMDQAPLSLSATTHDQAVLEVVTLCCCCRFLCAEARSFYYLTSIAMTRMHRHCLVR